MRYRMLGRTGLRVSELFLGAMIFGNNEFGSPAEESGLILDGYADAGGNVIDTADAYGDSEVILGSLLAGRRDRFVLASKYTISRDRTDINAAGNHRKNLRLALEQSLRRLRTDYLDLYWVHVWDPRTPLEETLRALDDAVSAGKILYAGISDAPAWIVSRANTLADWHDWTPFAGVQVPYSLLQRDIEHEILPMAESLGLTVSAWGSLAGGVLSGKYSGGGGSGTRKAADTLTVQEHGAAKAVLEVASELGASPAQVALAWTRARSRAVHPILGVRTLEQLRDNLAVTELQLPAEAVARLSEAGPFEPAFPAAFLEQHRGFVYGDAAERLD